VSMLDFYRRNAQRKQNDIARLQSDKARIVKVISNLTMKINSASDSISRTKSESTARTRLREIQRIERDLARQNTKIADIEKKIAVKHKELNNELEKIGREEKREIEKRERDAKKQADNHERQMRALSDNLEGHEGRLTKLENLPEKVTVLFMASNPCDQDRLRLDEEARAIDEMIRKSEHRDSVHFQTCWAVRPLDILQAVNEHCPTIIHFSGHGSEDGDIVLQAENGRSKTVTKDAIAQLLSASSSSIRLIFFNLCYSQTQAELVVQHIEAAVGMTDLIGDIAARVFAAQFYSAIGFGLSVKKAFQQAKAALMLEGIPEENTPELFLNQGIEGDDMVIVRPQEGS